MTSDTKQICFVCTGNTCRSPLAEYLFRHRIRDAVGATVSSAGVFAAEGAPASSQGISALKEWEIDLTPHRSRQLTTDIVAASDLLVVMTEGHAHQIDHEFPEAKSKVRLLLSFLPEIQENDVPDPIGQSEQTYRQTRDLINSAISELALYCIDQKFLTPKPFKEVSSMKIAIGTDHGGFELKEYLVGALKKQNVDILDAGPATAERVDYPDYAEAVARMVSEGVAEKGIVVCTSGIGMSIAANKQPGVRAALVHNEDYARLATQHNHANVIALGGGFLEKEEALKLVNTWLEAIPEGDRHQRRVDKISHIETQTLSLEAVRNTDPEVYLAMREENTRQLRNIELIASENYTSRAVREAQGSLLTNKYAEGYPGKRWYGGCEHVDVIEQLAIDRAKELFGAEHANVQPHSGSSANMAVYFSVLEPGDTILAMSLADGGHLTHGHPMNFSGRFFNIVPYGVDSETEAIDYDNLEKLAEEHKPKMITCGASAYSQIIDFERMSKIAEACGAMLLADMAHIAGLVAGGAHPSPVPFCDFVTTTTHKTLRGPRSGLILCREQYAKAIDRQVFPGIQGGPLEHVIAGKAICFKEALDSSFKDYAAQVVKNAVVLAKGLTDRGLRIVSGGTENHCFLVDLSVIDVTGKDASAWLDEAHITVNKNAIPNDQKSPFVTSGIRIGSPATTTRGMKEAEMVSIANWIADVVIAKGDPAVLEATRRSVEELTKNFLIP